MTFFVALWTKWKIHLQYNHHLSSEIFVQHRPYHLNVYIGLVLQTHIMSSFTRNTVIMRLAQQDFLVLTYLTHEP